MHALQSTPGKRSVIVNSHNLSQSHFNLDFKIVYEDVFLSYVPKKKERKIFTGNIQAVG